MKKILSISLFILIVFVNGCVYKPATQQGNILDQDEINKIEPGMTKEQITFILGNPVIDTRLEGDTWYYLYYLNPSYGKNVKERLILHFNGDVLESLEGTMKPEKEEE